MVVWLESAMARLCVPQALPGAPSAAISAPSLGSSLIVDPWILKNFLWKSGTVCSMEQTSLSHPLGVAGPGLWLSPVLPLLGPGQVLHTLPNQELQVDAVYRGWEWHRVTLSGRSGFGGHDNGAGNSIPVPESHDCPGDWSPNPHSFVESGL